MRAERDQVVLDILTRVAKVTTLTTGKIGEENRLLLPNEFEVYIDNIIEDTGNELIDSRKITIAVGLLYLTALYQGILLAHEVEFREESLEEFREAQKEFINQLERFSSDSSA